MAGMQGLSPPPFGRGEQVSTEMTIFRVHEARVVDESYADLFAKSLRFAVDKFYASVEGGVYFWYDLRKMDPSVR